MNRPNRQHNPILYEIIKNENAAKRNVSNAITAIADKQRLIMENCSTPVDEFTIFTEWLFKKKTPTGAENTDAGKIADSEKRKQIAIDAFKQLCDKHKRPAVKMELASGTPGPLDSFIGPIPGFLPKSFKYPELKSGVIFAFLGQVNCRELQSLPEFPHKGILSFWIPFSSPNDDTPMWDIATKVYWFENTTDGMTTSEISANYPYSKMLPDAGIVRQSLLINCKNGIEYPDRYTETWPCDEFVDIYNTLSKAAGFAGIEKDSKCQWFGSLPDDIETVINDYCKAERIDTYGTKCGGYPYYTQSVPRKLVTGAYSQLLFQCDSGDGVCWGDNGLANFHIEPSALQKHDFSDVFFHWDCY